MRKAFAEALCSEMVINPDIYLITADLGYGLLDEIKKDFPERFINCQAAEQCMLGIGIGLALQGKIPLCYSITPFLLHRPYEAIKLYLEHEKIPVKLIGSGRDKDYKADGISHWESNFPFEIDYFYPAEKDEIKTLLPKILYNQRPTFLSLKR